MDELCQYVKREEHVHATTDDDVDDVLESSFWSKWQQS